MTGVFVLFAFQEVVQSRQLDEVTTPQAGRLVHPASRGCLGANIFQIAGSWGQPGRFSLSSATNVASFLTSPEVGQAARNSSVRFVGNCPWQAGQDVLGTDRCWEIRAAVAAGLVNFSVRTEWLDC
jgi:hypothetical protein